MPAETLVFDASSCRFPPPRVPPLPTGLAGVTFRCSKPWASAEHFRHFEYGRYALYQAYRHAGIEAGSTLLAPAYHCLTMLHPALMLGGDVLLYPLRADLSPDIEALEAVAEASPLPVKAVLASHFFGFPQDFAPVVTWCAKRNIPLVEDCSHAFFCEHYRPEGIGTHGQFVVSSPYKFIPSPNGGLLYAQESTRLEAIQTFSPPLKDELRATKRFFDESRRSNDCTPENLDIELAQIQAQNENNAIEKSIETIAGGDDHAHTQFSSLRISRLLYRHPHIDAIVSARRDNYRQWLAGTSHLPYCRPLYPDLPEGCTPYMFPLLIEHPETHFYWLKHLGVPIWRWDTLIASDCPIANHYRFHLLHLPCHQSLTARQLDWMIAAVQKVCAGRTARNDA